MRVETEAERTAREDAEMARTGIIQCERQVRELARAYFGLSRRVEDSFTHSLTHRSDETKASDERS